MKRSTKLNKEQLVKKYKIKLLTQKLEEATGKKVTFKQLKEAPKKPNQIYQPGYNVNGRIITAEAVEEVINQKFGRINDYDDFDLRSFREAVFSELENLGFDMSGLDNRKTQSEVEEEIVYQFSFNKAESYLDDLYKNYPPDTLSEYKNDRQFLNDVKFNLEHEGVDMRRWSEINSHISADDTILQYYHDFYTDDSFAQRDDLIDED